MSTCGTCWRTFTAGWQLRHWAESSESDELEYECDDCDDGFYDEDDLRDQEIREHFYCDPCDRYF
ncbi:hypothetical protein H634G_11256 [Metarhizium anisopliae BRIP 53293]|uniref:C2H2-type domain-containing protein n=1 Tax=Metarhizium anisopliae BRIP 53293 TaxID=1291518 RepID=A0A0D9NHK3_METAN|nr:hypothetical protein H634G_11256 [Metarhizium anisopliae BRIP 53293]KJK85251.1 hypothetical protein H633G_10912 [Metarhizium anisopliae BRIP 53284]